MHSIIAIIFITSCILNVQSAPTKLEEKSPISIYDKLLDLEHTKCPYLKTTKLLEPNSKILETCSDYDTVRTVTTLNRKTWYNIPCLLYYNNFVKLCNYAAEHDLSQVVNNDSIDTALNWYNLERACSDLKGVKLIDEFKNATGVLANITKNSYSCAKICSELMDNTVTPTCSLAAYSVNLTRRIEVALGQKNTPVEPNKDTNPNHPAAAKPPLKPHLIEKPKPQPNKEPPKQQPVNQPANDNDLSNKKDMTHLSESKQPEDQEKPQESPPVDDAVNKQQETPNKKEDTELEVKPKNPQTNDVKQDAAPDVPVVPQIEAVAPPPNLNLDHEDAPNPNQETQQPKDNNENKVDDKKPNVESKAPDKSTKAVQEHKGEEDTPLDNELGEGRDLDPNNPQSNEDFEEQDEGIPPQTDAKAQEKIKTNTKPQETDEDVMVPAYNSPNTDEEDSFFFIYFMMVCAVFILGYIGYHNKQKVLALVIEGRRGRRGSRRSGRPNSANYHKLDSNLEEAVTSSCNKNTTNIIY